ncbi:MAG: (Fe-S)-binding protein [Thermodesulfobacteriota bacterium]|nr:(Fe-S)-binding protein [Thermodesulfobacteriota bacterium]
MDSKYQSQVSMCMQCGTCTASCPEAGITPLNIRKLVRKRLLQHETEKSIPWYCTSCGACLIRCPRDVKPSEMIIELRSSLVEEGQIPVSIQKALEYTFVQKNPWGRPRTKRGAWLDELDIEVPHISETQSKRLLFTCCIQAYDPRCMVIPVNVSKILNKGGVEFGVLGAEEACCGNEIRRMGESGLFEELQEENIATFQKHGVQEIITLSPHCMNTLKKEYGDSGIKISHYTEVVAAMIENGSMTFKSPFDKKVIYHDPCFLGKQNNIYDEPRNILRAIEGVDLLEFLWSRENSLCCEGGGGRMFYEAESSYQRNSEKKVLEAVEKGAEVLATSCPFCVMTLEDPATEKGLPVMELSEIITEVL